jgi:Phage major capsid protein E
MSVGLQIFQAARINTIMQALQDKREMPSNLLWLSRTQVVPAADGEIMARFVGRVLIADIIAYGAQAVVYSSGKLTYESSGIPKLKLGMELDEEMLKQLYNIQRLGDLNDMGIFKSYENRTLDALRLGIQQRMEAIITGMHIDGFSYDRLGIKMSNVTWGMPSDLKITPSTPWTNHGSATPVDDILTTVLVGRVRYGIVFNRLTMSTQAFREMIACTEFQNKARTVLAPNVSYVNLPLSNLSQQKLIAEAVLSAPGDDNAGNIKIEFNDSRYWYQNEDGTQQSAPFQPINKVILTSSLDDNDPTAYDFANGVVPETIASSLIPSGVIGNFTQPAYGPVAYATPSSQNLNPPGVTYWGAAAGWARKHRLQSSAVLTVGDLTDAIAVGEPF